MNRNIAILAMVAAVGICSVSIAADEAKLEDIRRLMETSGELETTRQAMVVVLDQMKDSGANVPDAYWGEFKSALATDELPSLLEKVYDHHYTHDEILALIDLYKSPIGQVLVKKAPLVEADAVAVGQRWAAETSQEIMSRLMPTRDDAGTTTPTE